MTEMVFLKEENTNPDFIIGEYTYYAKDRIEENFFEDNILYYRPKHDRLKIGKFCSIANGVTFIMGAANHSMQSLSTYPFNLVNADWRDHLGMTADDMPHKGDTIIGNDVWIGNGATIMPGVNVGDGAVIGAKAVVAKDIPPYSIVVGNPARVIRNRFDDDTINFLESLNWWDFSEEQLNEAIPYLSTVHLESAKMALQQIANK